MVDFVECFRHIECANVRSAASLNNFVNDAAYSTNGKVHPTPFLKPNWLSDDFKKELNLSNNENNYNVACMSQISTSRYCAATCQRQTAMF